MVLTTSSNHVTLMATHLSSRCGLPIGVKVVNNVDNEKKTERLRALINGSAITKNIVEDDQFIYFDTDDIVMPAMLLRQEDYETWYQETRPSYHVRVLKPNWFSHDLLQEDRNYD